MVAGVVNSQSAVARGTVVTAAVGVTRYSRPLSKCLINLGER